MRHDIDTNPATRSRPTSTWLATALLCACWLGSPSQAGAETLPGQVIRVIDGDSLVLKVNGAQYRVELAAIDAPEANQPWGMAATDTLHRWLTGRFVVVQGHAQATQLTGQIIFGGRDVGLDLVRDGLAWALPGSADDPHRAAIAAAQETARQEKRGLWSDDNPVAPWVWRAGPTR